MTPYQSESTADVDLNQLLVESRDVSFECMLVGDEHRPKHDDFDDGYTFEARDGTPVLYTGPAARVGPRTVSRRPLSLSSRSLVVESR